MFAHNRNILGVKIAALLVSIAMVLSFVPAFAAPQTAYAATGSTAKLVGPSQTIHQGDTFDVNVVVTYNGTIVAAEIDLRFDPSILTMNSITYAAGIENGYDRSINNGTGTAKLSFLGSKRFDACNGVTVATVSFTAKSLGNATISIPAAYAGEPPTGASPTTDIVLTPSGSLSYPVVEAVAFYVASAPYAGSYYMVTYNTSVAQGTVPAMDGTAMMILNGKYVALASSTQIRNLQTSSFDLFSATPQTVNRNGDLNCNSSINVIDAQLAYDLGAGGYSDFSIVPMYAWLAADVNNDGSVDSSDALAIQYKVHNGVFGEQ